MNQTYLYSKNLNIFKIKKYAFYAITKYYKPFVVVDVAIVKITTNKEFKKSNTFYFKQEQSDENGSVCILLLEISKLI